MEAPTVSTETSWEFARSRFRLVGPWLWELRKVESVRLCVFPMLAVLVAVDWGGYFLGLPLVDRYTFSGWFLEVLGLGTVATGLWGIDRGLRPNPPPGGLRSWLASNPLIKKNMRIMAGAGRLQLTGSAVGGRLVRKIGRGSNTATGLEILRMAVNDMQDEMYRLNDEMLRRLEVTSADLRSEAQARKAELSELSTSVHSKLEDLLVSRRAWEFIGVVWIGFGLTLATVPEFIRWVWYWPYRVLSPLYWFGT